MVKEAKEPTLGSLRSDIYNILNAHYSERDFSVNFFTDKKNNKLIIQISGSYIEEEIKKILNDFVRYKIKYVVRKKKEKDGNVIRTKKIFYDDYEIVFEDAEESWLNT